MTDKEKTTISEQKSSQTSIQEVAINYEETYVIPAEQVNIKAIIVS